MVMTACRRPQKTQGFLYQYSPGRSAMLQWKPTRPRIFGEYKLVVISWGKKKNKKVDE